MWTAALLAALLAAARADHALVQSYSAPGCTGAPTITQVEFPEPCAFYGKESGLDLYIALRCAGSTSADVVIYSTPSCTGAPLATQPLTLSWGCDSRQNAATACVAGPFVPPATGAVVQRQYFNQPSCPAGGGVPSAGVASIIVIPTGVCLNLYGDAAAAGTTGLASCQLSGGTFTTTSYAQPGCQGAATPEVESLGCAPFTPPGGDPTVSYTTCSDPPSSDTATPTATSSATATASPTPSPTETPTPTLNVGPPSSTGSETPSPSPSPSGPPSPSSSDTPSPSPSPSSTPLPSGAQPSSSETPSATGSDTASLSPSATPSPSPSSSPTPPAPSAADTPSPTVSPTGTTSQDASPSATASRTPSSGAASGPGNSAAAASAAPPALSGGGVAALVIVLVLLALAAGAVYAVGGVAAAVARLTGRGTGGKMFQSVPHLPAPSAGGAAVVVSSPLQGGGLPPQPRFAAV